MSNNYGYTLNSIWFTDAATGYIGGDQGFNLASTDSGKTWQQFAVTPGNFNFDNVLGIRFFNKQVGYLISRWGGIYRSTDAGKTWTATKPAPWECKTILMTSDTSMFIAGTYGTILKKNLREYGIDSLAVNADQGCAAKVSARVTAILSTIDSAWLEYGTTSFNRTIPASPLTVKDSSIRMEWLLPALSPDSTYQVRVGVRYRGADHYSQAVGYRPTGNATKPSISFNGTLLQSSASSGNQWFLNGAAIPGATGVSYQPTVQGMYTVQQTLNGCVGRMSEGFSYVTTAISDPGLAGAVQLLPNPVRSTLWLRNEEGKKLQVSIIDNWGRTLQVWRTSKTLDNLRVEGLRAGVYTVLIEEERTQRRTTAKLVKL